MVSNHFHYFLTLLIETDEVMPLHILLPCGCTFLFMLHMPGTYFHS